jgi:hypothetical protein
VSVLSVCGAGCVCIIIECRANERKKKIQRFFSFFGLSLCREIRLPDVSCHVYGSRNQRRE